MELRLAREQEFLQVRGLYWDIIDQMARAEYRPGWKKGIYPSDQWIRAALREGRTAELPVKAAKKARRVEERTVFLIFYQK